MLGWPALCVVRPLTTNSELLVNTLHLPTFLTGGEGVLLYLVWAVVERICAKLLQVHSLGALYPVTGLAVWSIGSGSLVTGGCGFISRFDLVFLPHFSITTYSN